MYVIYSLDTNSIEDAHQCVLVDVPDYECDSLEAMETWLADNAAAWGLSINNLITMVQHINSSKV